MPLTTSPPRAGPAISRRDRRRRRSGALVTLRHRERHEGKRNLRSVLFLVGRFDEIEGRNPVGLVYFCAWSLYGLAANDKGARTRVDWNTHHLLSRKKTGTM